MTVIHLLHRFRAAVSRLAPQGGVTPPALHLLAGDR